MSSALSANIRFRPAMRAASLLLVALSSLAACGGGGGGELVTPPALVVNSLLDDASPPSGTVTLRSALDSAVSGQSITFDEALSGGTIDLIYVAEEHTVLTGEVMGFNEADNISFLVGYYDRDYGKSALFADKDVVIDASALASGITLNWNGADSARVLAVSGDLTLNNVAITGGNLAFDRGRGRAQWMSFRSSMRLSRCLAIVPAAAG